MPNKIVITKTVAGKQEKQTFFVSDEKLQQIEAFFQKEQERKQALKNKIVNNVSQKFI